MTPEKEQQQRAAAVQQMVETEGWSIIAQELTSEADSLMTELLAAKDIDELRRLQSELKAIKLVLSKVAGYLVIET